MRHSPVGRPGIWPGSGCCHHQPCPGRPPPGLELPLACPRQRLALKHLLPQGQGELAGRQGVLGSRQPLPRPPHPQTLQGRAAESEWRQSLCRQAGAPVLRRPGGARGTGQPSPAPPPPRPALLPPGCPAPSASPLQPTPAWPAELGYALTSAALPAPEGPRPRTCGRRRDIQFAADTSSRHPGPKQPAAPRLKAEDAAAAPTQGSAHHLAPPACLAAVPTLPQGRISQALGKEVSRNAELRRIVQPEAVFGAKQKGSGMLQTLCSGRRTTGVGG